MQFPLGTPRWRRYLRFWQPNIHADIDDEIRFHFDERVEELLAQGVSPREAHRRAVDEFGDVHAVTQELRDIDDRLARRRGRAEWIDSVWQDVTFAIRSLRGSPGVAAAVVMTLALGLGVNTAVFSLLDSIFIRPPAGVVAPDRVRRLWSEIGVGSSRRYWPGYAYPQYQAVTDALNGIAETAIARQPDRVKIGVGGATSQAMLSKVSSGYFRLLGVRLGVGRFFTADEDRMGAGARVAVVSDAFWKTALGGETSALGRAIVLDGERYTVIGVAAPDFSGVDLDATDVWLPISTISGYGPSPWWLSMNVNGFTILLRLAPHVSDDAIDARATATLRRPGLSLILSDSSATTRVGSIIRARGPGKPAQEMEIATRLGGVAVIVLLIACANVVNLVLARAVRRQREIALRLALGISRARLMRLLMTESTLLAIAAGAAAILAAYWGGGALRRILLPDVHWPQSPLDWRVLTAGVTTTLIAGLVAGLIPAFQSSSGTVTDALKAGAREGHARRSGLRSSLVMAQAALSVVLLVGAMLFVQSLKNVRGLDLGFDTNRLLFARVDFESKDAGRDSLVPPRLADLADRLRGMPGIEGAALTAMRPMWGFTSRTYFPDADTIAIKKPFGMFWAVSPDYFAVTGTRLIVGRVFPRARGAAMPPSVVVNDAMARALWPAANPIGRCVRFERPDGRCNTVIGVVETTRFGQVIEEPTPQFYLPLENMPFPFGGAKEIAIRAHDADMTAVIRETRGLLRDAFPAGEPVITAMTEALEPQYRPWRLGATLFSVFGVLALIVAAIGIYSTVSYDVNQRTQEFGIRVALGARLGDILGHVLGGGLRTVGVGVALGVGGALLGGRLVASLLYGIAPSNPFVIAAVAGGLLLVATIAALGPAWRAARVDPMSALRLE
jgi:putative ABC transport system permease protein